MNGSAVKAAVERGVENWVFKGLARLLMMLFSAFGIPMTVWIVSTLQDTATTLKLLQQQVTHNADSSRVSDARLRVDMDAIRIELRERTASRYTRDDAERDQKIRDYRLDNHERRIEGLERSR